MRTIYIHIGAPKTGTSAIQVFLRKNRKKLLKNGILYCNTGMTENSGQAKLAWNLKGINFGEIIDDKIWNDLAKEINQYNGDILLSSEFFWNLTDNEIERLKNKLPESQIIIIVYLRRQDEWVMANALQEIKIYNKKWETIDEIIKNMLKSAYYYPILKKWSTICSNNIIVRPYEKNQFYENSIFADFLNCLNMKLTNDYILPEKGINPRLSRDAVEYKLIVNNLPIKKSEKNSILQPLFLYSKNNDPKTQKPFQDHMLLSPNERIKIIKKFDKDNKRVAREFLKRKDGKLFYGDLSNIKDRWVPYKGLDINTTVEISKNILKNKYLLATEDMIKNMINESIIKGVMSKILNEPMLLNLAHSYSEYNKYKYDNAETVYVCPLKELEKNNYNDIQNLTLKDDGLHIEAVGTDPILHMPYFTKKVRNRIYLLVKISITVPATTNLELFYGIIDSNGDNLPFDSERRIDYPLEKGKHTIYLEINSDGIINRLRLDPGKIPGKYILHELEVRA